MSTPAQDRAVDYVAGRPGCVMLECARNVGPYGSTKYGYAAIHRALNAGRLVARPGRNQHNQPCCRLYIPEDAPPAV